MRGIVDAMAIMDCSVIFEKVEESGEHAGADVGALQRRPRQGDDGDRGGGQGGQGAQAEAQR